MSAAERRILLAILLLGAQFEKDIGKQLDAKEAGRFWCCVVIQ